jgi:hypothetical protein
VDAAGLERVNHARLGGKRYIIRAVCGKPSGIDYSRTIDMEGAKLGSPNEADDEPSEVMSPTLGE